MSRSDLDKIQARLKVAIQSHQLLVTKMKGDPQVGANAALQRQLHDMQSQITVLSEKQKCIVQLLRKELVTKPNNGQVNSSPEKTLVNAVQTHTPSQTVTLPQSAVLYQTNCHPAKPLPTLAPKPAPVSAIQQATAQDAMNWRSDSVLQNKPIVNNNNKALKTCNAPNENSSSSLRVPDFQSHRPAILHGGPRHILSKNPNSALVPLSARRGSQTDLASFRKSSLSREDLPPEERKKLEFMASLDLITPDTLKELQSRRSERKRRSTANPQFSYGHFEPERKRATASYLSQVPAEQVVKRRGRPPKNRPLVLMTNPVTMPTVPPQE